MPQNLPSKKQITRFREALALWNKSSNNRKMPWKGERDPYKIWLSEIILQQTRVAQGLDYYERFIQHYPTIDALALAKDEAVFKLWEGLGYYSRCRNLLATARFISFEKKGIFPNTYESIVALKGVGPYTAAAIASFAFTLPCAVVDGNVSRVLARYFGIDKQIDTTEGKKLFSEIAHLLLNPIEPNIYNQSLMDFGATVCKPLSPNCSSCLLQKNCAAYTLNKVNEWPVKKKKLTIKKRWFYYFILKYQNKIFVTQRNQKDIWHHLHEFYLFESDKAVNWTPAKAISWIANTLNIQKPTISSISSERKQQLTHQQINGVFIEVSLNEMPKELPISGWLSTQKMNKLAFPRFITTYLEEKKLTLSNT